MKIAAIIPVYNREEFIGAYLDMLTGHGVDCFVALSDEPWGHGKMWGGNEESLEQDRTERILNLFPQVKVIKGKFMDHRVSFEAVTQYIQDYDRVIITDCDCYFTNEDWNKFVKFLEQDATVFYIDFEKMIIEYYFNYNYGKPALPGGPLPIVAYNPKSGLVPQSMTTMTGGGIPAIWNDPIAKIHHLRFAKKNGSGKNKCIEPASPEEYIPAPKEIKNLIDKWNPNGLFST